MHAQNCARSSTHECTRQKDGSHVQSALVGHSGLDIVPCNRCPGIATVTQLVAWCSSTARGPAATARQTWERMRMWVQNRVDGFLLAMRMSARLVHVLPRRYPAWQPPGSG